MTIIDWRAQRALAYTTTTAQASDLQARADILNDARLTSLERQRLVEPIDARIQKRYAEYWGATAERLGAAEQAYEHADPEAQLARAVLDGPERADTLLRLMAGAPERQVREFAKDAIGRRDLRAVWALRRTLNAPADHIGDEVRQSILKDLNAVTGPERQRAKAVLFAIRTEAARVRDETKPYDPVALLNAANEAAQFGGESITSREAADLLLAAGYERPVGGQET
jgi:hypothetical protein